MHGPKPTDAQVADLTAYLGYAGAAIAAIWDAGRGRRPPSLAARAVFRVAEVRELPRPARVHVTPKRYDVGLVDEVGNHEFNPPSLRAVSRRDAFLHDGRARSLREVFARRRHPRGLELSPR